MPASDPCARRTQLPCLTLGLLCAFSAGAAAAAPPAVNTVTAGDLQQFCVGSDHVSQNVCRIYILGVTQGVVLGLARGRGTPAPLCVPADISAASLEQALKARLEAELHAHPAAADEDGARFILGLLAQTYPCARTAAP